jgi:ubiquinone/menaquinone biosynthesis C-methylase UbiE
MAKSQPSSSSSDKNLSQFLGDRPVDWQTQLDAVTQRFNQEYRREPFDLPDEVQAMPIFQEWASGKLAARIASPFWEVVKPRKGQHCLDIGCGVSFLIYPWREWDALFYGQEVSTVAQETLNSRGSQLNSKLFKGVKLGGAHQLQYEANQFDLAIATGWSCYYPLTYWERVLSEVKRVLKPDGVFIWDVLDPETEIAENWAILETYLGAEVFLEPIATWKKLLKENQAQLVKTVPGALFTQLKVKFD